MVHEKLNMLRKEMADEGIDFYIIPTSDFHQSEYVSDYFKCREWLSGFTGSAGTLLVSAETAGLWTDGRYFLQAEEQLSGSGIELFRSGDEGVPTVTEYISDYVNKNDFRNKTLTIGFDGRVIDTARGVELEEKMRECQVMAEDFSYSIRYSTDLTDRIWSDRPPLPSNPIKLFSEKYCGRSAYDKLADIRKAMRENHCDYHLMTALDDIAWLLNLRGNDVACNPVFLSYMLVGLENTVLFCNEAAVNNEVRNYITDIGIAILPYNDIYSYCRRLFPPSGKAQSSFTVLLDPDSVNYSLYRIISEGAETVNKCNPTALLKAKKNETEIANLRLANLKDGVAMVRFLAWLDSAKDIESLTELSISAKLLEFRKESIPDLSDVHFLDISFDTISGYGAHGAIVHYEPTPESDIPVNNEGFLLVDSGAQYLQGTTDITRTIAMGPLTPEMKKHYTAVLRGNLALASAVFPIGTAGANLDILARRPLWDLGLDYNHGTGHGVGYYLNVHEGPQSFHWKLGKRKGNVVPLEPGMVITDEPGVYITGSHGIRTENDLLVKEHSDGEYGRFLCFEILTLCPIDKTPILIEDMTKDEIKLFNSYHRHVFENLSPYLNEKDREWLRNATSEI